MQSTINSAMMYLTDAHAVFSVFDLVDHILHDSKL